MYITTTTTSEIQRAHLYIYTKSKQIAMRFYTQKVRHFAKSKTICVNFLYTESLTLCVAQFFVEFLKLV